MEHCLLPKPEFCCSFPELVYLVEVFFLNELEVYNQKRMCRNIVGERRQSSARHDERWDEMISDAPLESDGIYADNERVSIAQGRVARSVRSCGH